MTSAITIIPEAVQLAYLIQGSTFTPITAGLINQTLRVAHPQGKTFILQRLSPIFSASVNLDIAAITEGLAAAGLETPRLLPSSSGDLSFEHDGHIWRMMTFIEGETLQRADSPQRCYSAAQLLGRFHRALWDLEYRFQHRRLGVHDTAKHFQGLEQALQDHREHRAISEAAPLAEAILEAGRRLPLTDTLPTHIVHGDPKISNILFHAESGEARCLVDLDTVAEMPIAVELGDALRSWCAPHGEDRAAPAELHRYRATLEGYASQMKGVVPREQWQPIVETTELIAIELAARFCADALNERYFGWDARRYPGAAEHHLARARAQLALAHSLGKERDELHQVNRAIWA